MGRVDAVALEGLDLWFNSSDHLPPHFHAKRRGEWEIRVYFLLCTDDELAFDVKWAKKDPATKVLAGIRKVVVEHRAELLSLRVPICEGFRFMPPSWFLRFWTDQACLG